MRKPIRHALLAAASACLLSGAVLANDDDDERIYGWIETATIEPWGTEVKIKLDSGALTSSIHAEDIEQFEKDGEKWVRYTLELEDEDSGETVTKTFEDPLYRGLTVRSAGGTEHRPVVLMKLCIGDTIYQDQFSLNDRSEMIYPVLLGRRLIQSLGPIDVTRTFLHEPECGEDAPVREYEDKEVDEDIGV